MDIAILNTGCANLTSIQVAIKKLGYDSIVTSDPSIVLKSKKIFLPGVGTALAAMEQLHKKNLINTLKKLTQPILGICLGMQIFSQFSEECKGVKTIGIFDNCFTHLLKSSNLPLPHMGWNHIVFNNLHPLFKNIDKKERFYFVHSYIIPLNKYTLAKTKYGVSFSSVMQKNNFFGVQFHPEKSGDAGAQLLKNFLEI
ncbi:imidazole glycerol phosphate synthase subunit HisH [Buchnera aphidicola]|uniref:Imidazole glycerol phosphate synthase subunit HisH n=1 Tax=Buchnera aphidicola subsp. Schizaphis graminum (strain Sg) TaxID=198804 RepID=HIS5_BUCAP|nr:imidazole glycerol phosphate synthase subunit HisH [Buchnera aphidicola]Q9ZHE3.1 RecName: Full=Imidazole glycerol phosphate synthase subunit HisH; AltName: Full=IGP synthase glutaminase subunit; AltName: Full=IGP synthase subunit HisH; AltName: Full=ImGP synthase subunit HisH; Short=IGPS subunit HisH [Buchnera aphidicola str. Sg (Schizaphis graminum)]AAC97358.1 amidotransferase [Buchnera aphidicola]AAM67666.1 amidotransferase [Buchnera aphidicola str. Sg (Schizaphis graminum)]AWI49838.1 imid